MLTVWDVILFLFAAVTVSLALYCGIQYLRQLGHVTGKSRQIVFGQDIRLESEELVKLCPRPIAAKWRAKLAPVIFLFYGPMIVLPLLGLIAMAEGWNFIEFEVVPGIDLIWAFLAILMLTSLYRSLRSIWKHRRLCSEQLTVLDESGRYQNDFARTTTSHKFIRAGILVSWFAAIMFQNASPSVFWLSIVVFVWAIAISLTGSLISHQTIFADSGYFTTGTRTDWSSVAEYRWFRDRDEVVFYLQSQNLSSPIALIPIPGEKATEVAAFLEQKLPGKRREDVETAHEELDADNRSLSSEKTPA